MTSPRPPLPTETPASGGSRRGRTLRPASAGVAFWLAVLIGGYAAFDAARVGLVPGLRWGGTVAVVLWVLWLVLWRPSIRIREDELDVVNALRTWTVPWSRVEDVESRLQYVIVLDDGRSITAWGSPASGRSARGVEVAAALRQFLNRSAASGGSAPIRRRTAWWSLTIPAVGTACLIVALTLPTFVSGR
jgi:hypothetical protein